MRTTKKGKPYLICDPCGVQMFVRVETGIRRFEQLVADADRNHIWKRLADLEQRYQLQCPRCGKKFWLTTELIKTSWMNGTLEGYRCPEAECGGIAKPGKAA
ncbi:MAG: hypothetical protein LAO03_17070 [Acidobacteriia bacterium]|nr:hypothetical protein [Terriglobia bacterium]